MNYTIYKITNKIDGKIYIGKHQTDDLNDGYMGSGKILRRAQKKHGLENFLKEILHIFNTEEEMNAKEKELVTEEFCLREDTYNLCVGGQGGFSYINSNGVRNGFESRIQFDEKTKSLCRKAADKGRSTQKKLWKEKGDWYLVNAEKRSKSLKEHYSKNGSHWSGRQHTEETKEKLKKSKNIGSENSQYGTMWITNGTENKKIKAIDIIPEGWYKGRVVKNNCVL
jgi:hypothetical protein